MAPLRGILRCSSTVSLRLTFASLWIFSMSQCRRFKTPMGLSKASRHNNTPQVLRTATPDLKNAPQAFETLLVALSFRLCSRQLFRLFFLDSCCLFSCSSGALRYVRDHPSHCLTLMLASSSFCLKIFNISRLKTSVGDCSSARQDLAPQDNARARQDLAPQDPSSALQECLKVRVKSSRLKTSVGDCSRAHQDLVPQNDARARQRTRISSPQWETAQERVKTSRRKTPQERIKMPQDLVRDFLLL
jgi:hypothetical protein